MRRFASVSSHAKEAQSLTLLLEGYRAIRGWSKLSQNSIRAYERAIQEFLDFFVNERPVHSLRASEAINFIDYLRAARPVQASEVSQKRGRRRKVKPLSESTITVRITALRSLFSVFTWSGMIVRNPFDQIALSRPSPQSQPQLAYYQRIEVVEMLAAANLHDKCLILLGIQGGLRSSELHSLKWRQVLLNDQVIEIHGDNTEIVHMSDQLADELRKLKKEKFSLPLDHDYVLELRTQYGIYQRLKNICQAAKVDFKGVQALRNTCGRSLLRKTGDARVVQAHLRLKTLEQAAKYSTQPAEIDSSIADMRV